MTTTVEYATEQHAAHCRDDHDIAECGLTALANECNRLNGLVEVASKPQPTVFAPFRFGPANAGPGGCCGKPVGCRIDSQGCIHKVEKKAWQQRAAAAYTIRAGS